MINLVMFSGGLDSCYLLWHLLTKTDDIIHCHHIKIINNIEYRWEEELEATLKIYDYCSKNYRTFFKSESTYELNAFNKYVGLDYDIVLLYAKNIAGNLANKFPAEYIQLSIGAILDDLESQGIKERRSRNVGDNLWIALHQCLEKYQRDQVNSYVSFPLIELKKTKYDIIKELPKELFNLSWYCRKPIKKNEPCKLCHSCIAVNKVLKRIKNEN